MDPAVENHAEVPPELTVGQMLVAWLDDPNGSHWRIDDWLRGHDLPGPGGQEEPYATIVRGLEEIGRFRDEGGTFCARVAALLNERLDLEPMSPDNRRLHFNLLRLCAALSCPKSLGGPLRMVAEGRRVFGTWHGSDLREVLSSAVVENQDEDRWLSAWTVLIRDGRSDLLAGGEYEGFQGLRRLRELAPQHADAALEATLIGLSDLQIRLDSVARRHRRFTAAYEQVTRAQPPRGGWEQAIARQALEDNWRKWSRKVVADAIESILILSEREDVALRRLQERLQKGEVGPEPAHPADGTGVSAVRRPRKAGAERAASQPRDRPLRVSDEAYLCGCGG